MNSVTRQPSARPAARSNRFVVLVANSKGGCGKTTLATNLTSFYAHKNIDCTIVDLDPQQSAANWLRHRPVEKMQHVHSTSLPRMGQINTADLKELMYECDGHTLLDAPAGLDKKQLDALVSISDIILIPVLPSPIDIHASTRFIQSLLLSPHYRRQPKRVAVIANRVRENTRMYDQLKQFLTSLKIPYLGDVRDSQLFAQAINQGLGIVDLGETRAQGYTREIGKLIEWLEIQRRLITAMPRL